LLLVLFQVSGYYLPWTPQRRYLRDLLRQDAELVRFLDKNQIRWVCGNYWVVYPIVFETQREVLGVPTIAGHDHYGFARELPAAATRWALVALTPDWLRQWVARTGLHGRIVPAGAGYHAFLPDPREERERSNQSTLFLLQQSATWGY